MKIKNLQLFLLLTISLQIKGQDLTVANTKMNILYVGIENPISFASKRISADKITLIPQRGNIIKHEDIYIYLNCLDQPGELVIYARNKQNKIIDSVVFRLRRLPDPKLRIIAQNMQEGAYLGTDILKDLIGVAGYFSDDYETPVSILAFTISVSNQNAIIKEITIEGSKIPDIIKEELNLFDKNYSIKLHQFKAKLGCVKEPRLIQQEFIIRK